MVSKCARYHPSVITAAVLVWQAAIWISIIGAGMADGIGLTRSRKRVRSGRHTGRLRHRIAGLWLLWTVVALVFPPLAVLQALSVGAAWIGSNAVCLGVAAPASLVRMTRSAYRKSTGADPTHTTVPTSRRAVWACVVGGTTVLLALVAYATGTSQHDGNSHRASRPPPSLNRTAAGATPAFEEPTTVAPTPFTTRVGPVPLKGGPSVRVTCGDLLAWMHRSTNPAMLDVWQFSQGVLTVEGARTLGENADLYSLRVALFTQLDHTWYATVWEAPSGINPGDPSNPDDNWALSDEASGQAPPPGLLTFRLSQGGSMCHVAHSG